MRPDDSSPKACEGPDGLAPLSWAAARRPVYVHPGFVFVSREPAEATTIVGSCVAICLWDFRQRFGGANHFLLPRGGESRGNSTRFGDVAIPFLVDELLRLGSRRADLQAKVFGGAAVIEAFRDRDRHLGAQNVELCRCLLDELEIPIVAQDVEGHRGRKVIFHTDCGIALVKLV